MTQKELALAYIKENGSMIPVKMSGKIFMGKMFGHSIDVRCRELRLDGVLDSKRRGKFEEYYLSEIVEALI